MRSLLFLLLAFPCLSSLAQGPENTPGARYFDLIQNLRIRAGQYYDRTSPGQDPRRAVQILDSILPLLDSPAIVETIYGRRGNGSRFQDSYADLAEAHAQAGNLDSALYYVEKELAIGAWSSSEIFHSDTLLQPIWNHPRYKAVLEKIHNQTCLWNDSALRTGYQPDISLEEKVAGLSLLWSQAKYNFVWFDHVVIDWDKTYMEYLTKVKNTTSTAEYYKVLMSFYAKLKDGHTNVYAPTALQKDFWSRPPIVASYIEGRVFVTRVSNDSLQKTGIYPGLEMVKIDDQPVLDYAAKNVAPYQSSSTPQDSLVRSFSYGLLLGPAAKPIKLTFKDSKGNLWTRELPRSGYTGNKALPTMDYTDINGIGCLTLNSMEDYSVIKKMDSLWADIRNTKGLIIDIRNNGGGSSDIGFHLLAYLIDKPVAVFTSTWRDYRPGNETKFQQPFTGYIYPSKKGYYTKPVVLLVGPRTFSAAEDCALAFDCMKRGAIIGQATGGSSGQPMVFQLPGGGSARVCMKRDSYPDGRDFVGKGIKPTIEVQPTIRDLQAGIDGAKQKALEWLAKQAK